MAFDEIQFPPEISENAKGGPEFRTRIITLGSGYERRNQDWSVPRGSWNIATGLKTEEDYKHLIAFFRARRGRARGFRFKDWSDFEVSSAEGILTSLTATTWQLYKRYDDGLIQVDRKITKPVNPITITGSGTYTVDYTTGIVTKTSGSAPTAWSGEFDVPVRFDTDLLNANKLNTELGEWPDVPVVELRI